MKPDINTRTSVLILAGGRGHRLDPLTRKRAKPVVPFGGVYRIIDFTLSNCLNSGLQPVYVLTQDNRESLHSYLDYPSGQRLTCVPPATGLTYSGTADAVYQNLHLIERRQSDYVLILSADHIYKMDYSRLLRFHQDMKSEVTVSVAEYPRRLGHQFGVLEVDSSRRIVGFDEKPREPKPIPGKSGACLASMGIYVFNTDTLKDALTVDAARVDSAHDFGTDVLPRLIRSHGTFAFCFEEGPNRTAPYWRDVGTIDAYYKAHMELLLANSPFAPCENAQWPMQAFGSQSGRCALRTSRSRESSAVDSLLCPEASVEGRVVHSVISPAVTVELSAEVRDSILMRGAHVGNGAHIRHAIVEDNVRIPENARIGYDCVRDRRFFKVSDAGVVVVTANAHFPGLNRTLMESESSSSGGFQEWPTLA